MIDEQHKELIDLVNDIYHHISDNKEMEKEYFNFIISEIVKYIRVHIVIEEKILDATKLPGYIEHKRSHKRFMLSIFEIFKNYQEEKQYSLLKVSRFLKDWVLSHIAIIDKDYFVSLCKKNPRYLHINQ